MGRKCTPYSKIRKRTKRSVATRLAIRRKNEMRMENLKKIIACDHNYVRTDVVIDAELPGSSGLQNLVSGMDIPQESPNILDETGMNEVPIDVQPHLSPTIRTPTEIGESRTPEWSLFSNTKYDEIMAHELCIEVDNTKEKCVISGNRIVDLNYVLKWALPLQSNHSKKCSSGLIYLKEERRYGTGLVSSLTFACTMCSALYTYDTEEPAREPGKKSKINYGLVWGTLSTGSTFTHTKELLCSMDIPPMTLHTFKKIEENLGNVTKEEQAEIQNCTIGQFDNQFYIQKRTHRLTASNFGSVIKRQPSTPCHSLVKQILYGDIHCNAALEYGKSRESMVRARFAVEKNLDVEECGLFIDLERGYLGASPDGLIGDYGLLEIKCLYKVAQENISLTEAVKKYNICLKYDSNEELLLNRNHNYYYQIQGQLNICQKDICYFVIYSGEQNPLYVEEIKKDEELWKQKMIPKLEQFYMKCILPEIVMKNITRGEKCEDPDYIKEAQLRKQK